MTRTRLARLGVLGAAALAVAVLAALPTAPASAETRTCLVVGGRADASCTPGAFNPDVSQATIDDTICVSGYSGSIRPPASYTTRLKNQQKPAYGEARVANADLEEDHLVPLSLGGAPRDPRNLWPEPRSGAAPGGEGRSEEHTSELQSRVDLVCRLLLEKKNSNSRPTSFESEKEESTHRR